MASPPVETVRCDVLVAGGGISGAVAAIVARETGWEVLLADRSFFGASGCTALASGMFSYFKPGDDLDHWLRNHGGTMVNETLLAESIEALYELTHRLEDWGVEWVRDENGEIARMGGPGIPFPHSAMMVGGGPAFMMAIAAHARRIGVRVLNRTMLTDLLTSDGEHPTGGRVVGALALDTRTGALTRIEAKATVLATGPMHFPYPRPDSPFTGMPVELSGDGIAIGLRAGADLGKMEMGGDGLVQGLFHAAQGFEMLLGLGGSFVNALGEDFLARYAETRALGAGTRRSELGTAGTLEIVEGRGPVLRENRELEAGDLRLLEIVLPIIMRTFASAGIRVERDLVPYLKAMPGSTAVTGAGLRIDERGAASLPGLFAAGNVSDGAYVIMGQNIATCAVIATWAGGAAAECAAASDPVPSNEAQVGRLAERALAGAGAEGAVTYDEAHDEIEEIILELGHVLDDRGLSHAIERIRAVQTELLPRLGAGNWHEFAKIPGLRNFSQALEVAYAVMRHRRESRGNILRSDYPYIDNERWLTMTVARFDGERVSLRDVPRPRNEHYRDTQPERIPHPFFEAAREPA
jgi:succinate dehydrogenase/fumarate reductase flavoprotein subunit